jgi:hypothetical protein
MAKVSWALIEIGRSERIRTSDIQLSKLVTWVRFPSPAPTQTLTKPSILLAKIAFFPKLATQRNTGRLCAILSPFYPVALPALRVLPLPPHLRRDFS